MTERVVPFAMGFVVPLVVQPLVGWWLNSGRGVAFTTALLFVMGIVVSRWRPGTPWPRARALWLGSVTGSAAVLFWIGPGTIWPIVLAFAAGIGAAAAFGGAAAARPRQEQ